MTLQGDPQVHIPPAAEAPFRFRRGVRGTMLKSFVVAATMTAAIAMTPPLPNLGPPQSAGSSIALGSASFQRQAAPAVASPRRDPAAPVPAEPAPPEQPAAAPRPPSAEPEPAAPPTTAPEPPPAVVVPSAEAAPQPPATEPQPAQPGWTIYVAGSGGQDLVDACIGPVHFTPTDAYSLFITEHDSAAVGHGSPASAWAKPSPLPAMEAT
jgi:hypothetical protein